MISIEQYLERIRYAGPLAPTEETLAALHAAHSEAIPFENLDIHMGLPIRSDVESLFGKIVLRKRGGYCLELNALFAALLEGLGFRLRLTLGRVTLGATVARPRGHLLCLVETGRRTWVADVGYGPHGLLEPVPLEIGPVHETGGEAYRVVRSPAGGLELEMKAWGAWRSLYWFDETPCHPIDIDVMNVYHLHSPASVFHQNRVIALTQRDRRLSMVNNELRVIRGDDMETRLVPDEETYRRTLADEFGIELPPDAAARMRPHPSIRRLRA